MVRLALVIMPPLTSEMINTIKNSSVALTIGLAELTARTRAVQEFSFQVFEAFTAATVIYLLLNLAVTSAMRAFEKRLRLPGYGTFVLYAVVRFISDRGI